MGWKDLFSIKANKPSKEDNKLYEALYKMLGYNLSILAQDAKTYIKEGYITNPHIYSVINKIIRPASQVPFYVYRIKDKQKAANYASAMMQKDWNKARLYKHQAFEIDTDNDLQRLLDNPNQRKSAIAFREEAMGYKLLTGNNFIYGVQPAGFEKGYFSKIYNMPSQLTEIVAGKHYDQLIEGYRIESYFKDLINPESVLHRKYFNPDFSDIGKSLYGLSPLSPLLNVVKKSNDAYLAGMKILQNGHPVGIISDKTEGFKDPITIGKLKDDFQAGYGGAENKNKVFWTSADIQWQAMGLNSVDLQLIDSNNADLKDIARVYQVPLPLIADDASTYNNVKEAKTELWTNAIIPELTDLRDSLNAWLTPYYKEKGINYYIDFDLDGISALKQDEVQLTKMITDEIQHGMLTPNEARQIKGRDLVIGQPELDMYYLKSNINPIKKEDVKL